jgi:DNA-binding transcriptional MerR regulator
VIPETESQPGQQGLAPGNSMAYTVKQVAEMSGVSVRTLHFYDELGLLKPAYLGPNGYRFYEESQLLTLQQILFYRELEFELKQIKEILDRKDFERVASLEAHREVLRQKLSRTHQLLETIDKTLAHLKGARKMKTEELFAGFSVAAGDDRFGERITLGGEPNHCKVSAQDTHDALCIFELTGVSGGPRHLHHEQDEWIYVVEGEWQLEVGTERLRLTAGESVFIPRNTAHVWASASEKPGKVINVYQPAGRMEEFFREVSRATDLPTREQVVSATYREEQVAQLRQLFADHGMALLGGPLLPE